MDKAGGSELAMKSEENSTNMRVGKVMADLVQRVRKRIFEITDNTVKGTDAEITDFIAKKYISKGLAP